MSRQLDVYRLALELASQIRRLLPEIQRFDRDLATQLRKATTSVPLNISEALRRRGRDRGHLLSVALGSAAEVQAILDVSIAMALFDSDSVTDLEPTIDRICAMLYRLRGKAP